MYFTGFADEASKGLEGQIKATKELGWTNIESRAIDGVNIHDLPEEKFNQVADALDAAGIHVNCFGSTICNWAKKITDPFDITIEEINRAIPRMQRLGSKLIRIMSYARMDDRDPHDQMQDERFRRLREVTKRFLDAGIQPVHENCMNYGGMGWPFTLELLENVPGLKLVFDTGNCVGNDDKSKAKPYEKTFLDTVPTYLDCFDISCKYLADVAQWKQDLLEKKVRHEVKMMRDVSEYNQILKAYEKAQNDLVQAGAFVRAGWIEVLKGSADETKGESTQG